MTKEAVDLLVSPTILGHGEPQEVWWFVWDRRTDQPWALDDPGMVLAFAFESDAQAFAGEWNGASYGRDVLDGRPRQTTAVEAANHGGIYEPVALFDRDLNLIRRLA